MSAPLDGQRFVQNAHRLRDLVQIVIKGKNTQVEQILTCLLAGGHVLLDDKPGTGKTTLAKRLAQSIRLDPETIRLDADGENEATRQSDFGRIQFTPDLLPSDITGAMIWQAHQQRFTLTQGPIFAHVVLADEINRASPKTQSALLEVMAEQQVTIGTQTRKLRDPFMVIATQNPHLKRIGGTYELPPAQLDRFMMRLTLDYPDIASTVDILRGKAVRLEDRPIHEDEKVSIDEVAMMVAYVRTLPADDGILHYIAQLCDRIAKREEVDLGGSPRGSADLLAAAKAKSAIRGDLAVDLQLIRQLAEPVLAHRIMVNRQYQNDLTAEQVVRQELDAAGVP